MTTTNVCGISVKPAGRELIQPGGTLCIHHLCTGQIFIVIVLWNNPKISQWLTFSFMILDQQFGWLSCARLHSKIWVWVRVRAASVPGWKENMLFPWWGGGGLQWSFKQPCGNLPHLLLLRFRTQKITSTHWPKNLHDWAQNQWRGLLFSINYDPWQEWGSMKNYTLIVTSTTHPFIHFFDALKPKVMTGAQHPLWIMWHWKPQAKMVE